MGRPSLRFTRRRGRGGTACGEAVRGSPPQQHDKGARFSGRRQGSEGSQLRTTANRRRSQERDCVTMVGKYSERPLQLRYSERLAVVMVRDPVLEIFQRSHRRHSETVLSEYLRRTE